MPLRYTCHLAAIKTGDNKFRVQYAPIGEGIPYTFRGPQIVLPPESEMTWEECEEWSYQVACYRFTVQEGQDTLPPTGGLSPVVRVERTFDIPEGKLRFRFEWLEEQPGQRSLTLEVTNEWDQPMPNVSISLVYSHTPQSWEGAPAELAMLKTGGSASFLRIMPGDKVVTNQPALLRPGDHVKFVLPPNYVSMLLTFVASLSREDFWISIKTGEVEFDRVASEVVAQFVDTTEGD